jgi:histidinol dehydrogenase
MLPILDLQSARRSVLRRPPPGEAEYPAALLESVARLFGEGVSPSEAVTRILHSVRCEGDAALKRWGEILDRARLEDLRVPPGALAQALADLPSPLAVALNSAADRIRAFHARQPVPSWDTQDLGGTLGQRFTPIRRVGVYVPGGSAPLPSSLLMAVIPAQVAGVEQIVVCTPPNPHPAILAAAYLCGLQSVYQVGGAQAIAAMAYGTESVPKVDKIVGAGNLFVTLAKQQVYGVVGIDGLAGPTETMIIADARANPVWLAADLLAQAEHDPLASAILLTPAPELARAVQDQVGGQMESLGRAEIIAASLAQRGGIVLVPDLPTAAQVADEYAPEHLCLAVENPQELAKSIRNAGGIFLGEHACEVLGDYVAGPSHIMPTGGSARFASPLNVLDFVKITSLIGLDPGASQALSSLAAEIAEAETLTAHAAAARLRGRRA